MSKFVSFRLSATKNEVRVRSDLVASFEDLSYRQEFEDGKPIYHKTRVVLIGGTFYDVDGHLDFLMENDFTQ